MRRTLLATALAVTSLAGMTTFAAAGDERDSGKGPMAFTPLAGSAYGLTENRTAPFAIPNGFRQAIVSDETDLDIYKSLCAGLPGFPLNPNSDWLDMTVSNETGKQSGRYLYRTHEVRPFLYDTSCAFGVVSPAARAAYIADGGGALSVIDTKTGTTKVLAQRTDWDALDGLLWSPWGTLLFAEETLATELPDPQVPQAQSGLLYELQLDKKDPTKSAGVKVRPQLGALAHEGIESDQAGNIYVIDEDRRGSIYRFVPKTYGDLSNGQLQVLKVANGKTGAASWVNLDMTQAQISARVAATAVGGTQYCRPEDMERIKNVMYVALTCEDVTNPANIATGPGAVLAITLGATPSVRYFVSPPANVPSENPATRVTGFKAPDNLADGPDGNLWIVEDNPTSDIWVASPDKDGDGDSDSVQLFASLKDTGAEATGIYFGKDPKTLFVNIQHATSGNDSTIAITSRRDGDDNDDRDDRDK